MVETDGTPMRATGMERMGDGVAWARWRVGAGRGQLQELIGRGVEGVRQGRAKWVSLNASDTGSS